MKQKNQKVLQKARKFTKTFWKLRILKNKKLYKNEKMVEAGISTKQLKQAL